MGPPQRAPGCDDESGHSRRPDVHTGESLLDALVRWLKTTGNTHSFFGLTFLPVMHTTVQKGCSLLLLQILGGRSVTLATSLADLPQALHFYPPRRDAPPAPTRNGEGVASSPPPSHWGRGLTPPTPPPPSSFTASTSLSRARLPWRGHTSLPSPLPALSWGLCRPRKPEVSGRTQQAPPFLDPTPNIHPVPGSLALDSQ